MINAFFMIKYTNEDKTLTVPSGLGNFAMNGGGGGDVTRQDVINIVDSAITEYDTEIQVDLEDIRENVSGNTDNIEALSATTENMAQSIGAINTNIEALSAATDNMASNVEALSAATGNIQSNVESISGQTSANTAAIAALSSATENVSQTVVSVSGNVESVSAQTTANTADIETLSGVVETNETAISNLENYTQNELVPAISGIGQDLETLSGQVSTLSSSTVNGLETAQNTANSARTEASSAYTLADSAYTLAASAYTLADSLTGQTGGGIEKVETLPQNPDNGTLVLLHIPSYTATTFYKTADVNYESGYNLFNYNGEERYSDGYGTRYGIWIANSEYRIRYRRNGDGHLFADVISEGTLTLGSEADGSQTTTIPDRYELWKYENGEWFQLDREWVFQIGVDGTATELFWRIYSGITDENPYYLTIRYSSDGGALREFKPYDFKYYGMDCQASDSRGSEDGRFGSLRISSIRFNWDGVNTLTSDIWLSPITEEPAGIGYFNINSDGTVPQDTDRYSIQGKGVIMIKCGEWNRGWVESLSFTDDYTVLHIKGKIQIDGTEYAGYWTWTDGQGEPWSKVSFTAV